MGCTQLNEKLVSWPKIGIIPRNSFKTKAIGFCKRAADVHVVVVKFFIKIFTARESNDRQTFDWMNSIKFKASLLTKHWTYQTLNECINASVVILPIEKYKLIQRPDVVVVKFCVIIFFSPQENGMTVKLSMGVIQSKFKTTFLGEHTTYNSNRIPSLRFCRMKN